MQEILLIVSLIFLKDCLFACLCVCLFCYFGAVSFYQALAILEPAM